MASTYKQLSKPYWTHFIMIQRQPFHKPPRGILLETVFAVVVLALVIGNIALAIIDSTTRPAFADLSKVALGAYLGLLMPKGGAN
jgi:hypothetical protein